MLWVPRSPKSLAYMGLNLQTGPRWFILPQPRLLEALLDPGDGRVQAVLHWDIRVRHPICAQETPLQVGVNHPIPQQNSKTSENSQCRPELPEGRTYLSLLLDLSLTHGDTRYMGLDLYSFAGPTHVPFY